MAKKNSRDLFKQMNSNVSLLEEADQSPILGAGNEKNKAAGNKTGNRAAAGTGSVHRQTEADSEKAKVPEEADPTRKKDKNLVRITYNLTNELNEKLNRFTEQHDLYKTSLIKALMEGWLEGSIGLDEDEILFNDGLVKIKKKAGPRKAVGSILAPAELDTAFTRKCRETGIDKNNCIFRLLKFYLEQKMPES